ncbi:MAG: caspase family protein [Myxococcales bacterium]|nr:caspase family protein [Myxococcales bacterium]MDD9969926.1 caspase family protein [Myxococcales bacterium]
MRRALLIGIDNYPTAPLNGCVADVERLQALLLRHEDGEPNFEARALTAPREGQQLDKAEVRKALEEHFLREADTALLHFSGHGMFNDLGGFIVTSDGKRYDEGISMHDLMRLINQSKIPEITILLDCCHSGAMGLQDASSGDAVVLREGVSIIAASGMSEVSVETDGGGLFTSLICDALGGQAADLFGHVTVPSLYAHVDSQLGAWDQRPRFRANLRRLSPIRRLMPPIPRSTLRKLAELFETENSQHRLSPAHEPSLEPHDHALEHVFAELQSLCREGIVEPVDERHMYYAALNGGACRLTPRGRRYFRLATAGKI